MSQVTAGIADEPLPPRALPPTSWRLWFGLLGGHSAWTIQLLVGYFAASLVCHLGNSAYWALLWAATLLALTGSAAAGIVSYRVWRGLRAPAVAAGEKSGAGAAGTGGSTASAPSTGDGRSSLMALLGVMLSATFLLVVLVSGVAPLLVHRCG
jgi:hypothetical protein